MGAGRKPKPIEVKQREGNAGKRPLPEPLTLPPGAVSKPEGLPADAEALWDDLVPRLDQIGIVNQIDQGALAAMCVTWARARTSGRVIRQEGFFALGSMGQLVEHPALAIERQSFALFLRFAEQYALTPVARARVAAALRERGSEDELDAIISSGPVEL